MTSNLTSSPWTPEEEAQLPYGFRANNILTSPDDPDILIFAAIWNEDNVVGETPTGPWKFLKDNGDLENLTIDDWEIRHPGIKLITVNDWHHLEGTYKDKDVHWSCSQQKFAYYNHVPVHFPEPEEEEEQVSQLLEASIQSVERSRSRLTPEATASTLPGSFNTPVKPHRSPDRPKPIPLSQPTIASSSTGKTPVRQPPPVSKRTPTMSQAQATPKAVGTPPKQFDGTASQAEGFLSALQNYYYLNETLFPDESRKVAAALTHFKVGSPAGEWARNKQTAALAATPITFGSWNDFITQFKAHFIPVQTEQQAMNAIWQLKMGNRPFHEWYQEWSTYASRSGANDATKMYAFRQALPQGLNDKLVGLATPPTTLTALVEHARLFDQQWQMWRRTGSGPTSSQRPQGPRIRANTTDDTSINLAETDVRGSRFKKLTKEDREKRMKNGECLYCGKQGHFARECRTRPAGRGRGQGPRYNPTRTRLTDIGEEAPSELPESSDATVVSRIYQDPQYHFTVPEPTNAVEDF
jgi:hypothetical protein